MTTWPSPAKLNLFLYITERRSDNYHNLQTLFQFIDYCDELTFTLRNDNKIQLTTVLADVAHDSNLIIKAAQHLLNYSQLHALPISQPYGIDITIDKKLPIGGGLGGGSSNAATTLVALNQIWQLNLSQQTLMVLGRELGADVPIFIFGHSAFAQGIGDILQPIQPKEYWYLVVKPDVNISTAKIFAHPKLKRDSVTKNIEQLLAAPFNNDCEAVVREIYPKINSLIELLSRQRPTRLTGTGSCIFCECDTKQQALELQKYLIQQQQKLGVTDHFIAKGLNHSPLLTAMSGKR